MNETLSRPAVPEFQQVPVMPEGDISQAVTAAEQIVADSFAQQSVAAGAEQYLLDQAPTPEASTANPVEFNANMLQLFMLAQNTEMQKMLAGAIALDLVGQQHGIKEFTFANAAATRHRFEAERAAADLRRQQEEDDKE